MSDTQTMDLLVVDDDTDLLKLLKTTFEMEGFRVRTATAGPEGLKAVYEHPPDAVILDVRLPGMNGFEVCKELKLQRTYNLLPVLMLTARSRNEDRIEGLITGADAYITKPFDTEELVKLVKEAIEEANHRRENMGMVETISFDMKSEFRFLEEINGLMSRLFQDSDLSSEEIWEMKLALHELGVNAIEHGNQKDQDKLVRITYTIFKDRLEITVEDEGEGFDPETLPDPTEGDALVRDRGRGVYLVKRMMDGVEYLGRGNAVRLTKLLQHSAATGH